MAITALELIEAAQVTPAELGSKINPKGSPEQQQAAMVVWLDNNVLSLARSEVTVPLLETAGSTSWSTFIDTRFPQVPDAARTQWKAEGEELFDAAHLSYSRSEYNKQVKSSSDEYDKDSDQDRIQGNQRLAKLLSLATTLIKTGGQPGVMPPTPATEAEQSGSVSVRVRRRY